MRTAGRILDIFEVFAAEQRPMTLSEVADALRAPVSSCFGLLKILEERGYLHAAGVRKELYPTRRMLQNTRAIAKHEPVIAQLMPFLQKLRDETDETVILGQLAAGAPAIVYLELLEGTKAIRYTARVGERKPLYSTAIGKALLSAMPEPKRASLLQKLKMPAVTARTIVTAPDLEADIEQGLKRGFQMTRGENVTDVGAIARPLTLADRQFAIAIAGPLPRLEPSARKHARHLKATCEALEALLG